MLFYSSGYERVCTALELCRQVVMMSNRIHSVAYLNQESLLFFSATLTSESSMHSPKMNLSRKQAKTKADMEANLAMDGAAQQTMTREFPESLVRGERSTLELIVLVVVYSDSIELQFPSCVLHVFG